MRLLFFVIVLFLSFNVFASEEVGITGFFTVINIFFLDIYTYIFQTIPNMIDRFFIWVPSFLLYLKFYFIYESLVFSHSVALSFLEMINITDVVNSAVSSLPSDVRQAASDMRFFEGATLIIEALITRLIYSGF